MSVAATTEHRSIARRRRPGVATVADGFEAIYDAHHGRIFGLAYRMLGDAEEASDVTQDTFISAYQNLHKLKPRRKPGGGEEVYLTAWLHRIATNKCIDALRQRKRRTGVDWDAYAETAPASNDPDSHPEVYATGRERADHIQRILDEMTPNYRLALLMQEYQGMSVREIAYAMNRSESAIKSLLFRAREQFRALYELESALARAA